MEIKESKVKSFKSVGKKVAYDLTIDSKFHNFYLNGLVTSNSHSHSYSVLAAKTVYLKHKYPKQFFCSILETAEFSPDPLGVIAEVNRELPDFGIRLLPPDLQKSKLSFTIEDNGIRYGLSSIKGISGNIQNALKEFVKVEPQNKYDVFIGAKQCGINIGVLSSLIYAGALGEENRSKIVLEAQCFNLLTDREKRNIYQLGPKYNYDLLNCIAEISKEKTVGDDSKPIFKDSRFETFRKKFEPYKELYFENKKHECLSVWWFEKTLLGYSYTHKLRDCFNQQGDLLELKEALEDRPESWRAVGQIDDFFVKTSQNGNRYAKITISDDSATATLMFCDGKKEKKLTDFLDKSKLSKGSIILVKVQSSGGTNFVDTIKVIDTKIYTKIRDLK